MLGKPDALMNKRKLPVFREKQEAGKLIIAFR
jgi:hypothetical protein